MSTSGSTIDPRKSADPGSEIPFELDLLEHAFNYQQWVAAAVRPYMGARILEIGAGTGNMSRWLPIRDLLVLTEAEPQLLDRLKARARAFGDVGSKVIVSALDLSRDQDIQQPGLDQYELDTIVSFNVLEHIEDDRRALQRLINILRESPAPVRRLVSFVPAQSWALSDLDRYYGHFRRYSARSARALSRELAPDAELSLCAFNALGLVGWVWSTMVLGRTRIDPKSVRAYDAICRFTKHVDNFVCRRLRYPLGQSLVWVLTWRR